MSMAHAGTSPEGSTGASFEKTIASDLEQWREVVNTNKCFLHLEVHEGQILISSVIDNLIKGGAGQAIQSMNIALGLDEQTGLGDLSKRDLNK